MNSTINIWQLSSSSMDALRACTAILGVIIYTAGFIGNFFALLLFTQKELRRVSTGLIFLLLNIINTIHLLSLVVEFLDSIFQVQVLPSAVFQCQFILWLQNATRTLCSFLATTVSIDRFIRSEYPVKSRIWCTPKNTLKLAIIYSIFSILLYAFFFYPLNLFDDNGACSFSLDSTFRIFAVNVMPPVRFFFTIIIPSVIMVGCGGRMLYNIRQSHERVTQQTTIATIIMQIPTTSSTNNEQHRQKNALDQMLLLMVTSNVVAYILTQMPFNIYAVYHGYETSNYLSYSLTRTFLLMWSSVYFGVGFYLFCVASPQFRKQFLTKIKTFFICWSSSQRQASLIRTT
jgi:hypothetical protein